MGKSKLQAAQKINSVELYRSLLEALKIPKLDVSIQEFLNTACQIDEGFLFAIAIRYKNSDEFVVEFTCHCKKSIKAGSCLVLDADSLKRLDNMETIPLSENSTFLNESTNEKKTVSETYYLMPLLCESRVCALFIYTNIQLIRPEGTDRMYWDYLQDMLSMKVTDYIQYRELEIRKNHIEIMESASPVPIHVWQKRGDEFYLVHFNESAQHATDRELDDAIGQSDLEFYADLPQISENIRFCNKSNVRIYQELSSGISGENQKWFHVMYVPAEDNRVSVILDDMTERKEDEETLKLQRDFAVQSAAVSDYTEAAEILFENVFYMGEAEAMWMRLIDMETGADYGTYLHNADAARVYDYESFIRESGGERTHKKLYHNEEKFELESGKTLMIYTIRYSEKRSAQICIVSSKQRDFSIVFRKRLRLICEQLSNVLMRLYSAQVMRESEMRYSTVFENIFVGISIFEKDPDGNELLIDCNPSYAINSGYSREELKHISDVKKLQKPLPVDIQRNILLQDIPPEGGNTGVYTWIRPDNKENFIEFYSESLVLDGKEYIYRIERDVTIEKLFRDEIAKLARFPSENPNPVIRLSGDGETLYVNKSVVNYIYPYISEEEKYFYAGWKDIVKSALKDNTNKNYEKQFGDRVYQFIFTPVIAENYVNIYGSDVTDLHSIQKEYNLRQIFYSQVLNTITSGVVVTDENHKIEFYNQAFSLFFDLAEQHFEGDDIFNLLLNQYPEFQIYYNDAYRYNRSARYESAALKIRNKTYYISGWFLPRMEKNAFKGVIWTTEDVSDRMAVERNRKQEDAYRELRVDMWKIAADKSISTEDELVKKLFDITGECVKPSRISLNKIGADGNAWNIYEWLKPGQKPSPKSTYIPKGVWSQLQDSGNYFEFTPKTMGELLLPGKIFSPFKRLIESIFINEGLYTIVLFPYKVDGKMESIMSFDWCEGNDKVWSQGEIYAGLDLCKILSMNTSKIRSEAALQESEKKLRESEAHFRSLLENSKSFVLFRLTLAPEEKIGIRLMMVSPSIWELFGIADPYNLSALSKNIHPDDLRMIVDKFYETVPIGQINIEFRFNHPKKGRLWINGMATAITDEFGNIRYINGILTDNTQKHIAMDELVKHKEHLEELVAIRAKELTKTYEQLNESEKKLRAFFDSSVEAFILTDTQFNVLALNESAIELSHLMCERELNVGDDLLNSFAAGKSDAIQAYCARALSGEKIEVSEMFLTDNRSGKWFEFLYNPVRDQNEDIIGICLTGWDITERKSAEENLIASEQRFRAVVQDQTDFIVRFQTNGQIKFVNQAFCRLFDQNENVLIDRSISSFFAKQFVDEIQHRLKNRLYTQGALHVYEDEYLFQNGRRVWVKWTLRAIFGDKSAVTEFQAVGIDETSQKMVELQEKKLIEKLRNIYSELGDFSRIISSEYNPLSQKNLETYGITDRERQVISLVVKGLKNKEIADKIHISDESVKKYLTHVFEKLSVKNRVELVSFIKDNQIPV